MSEGDSPLEKRYSPVEPPAFLIVNHRDTDNTDIQTYRPTDVQIYRHADIQKYRHTDIQTYRHTDITDTQTHRHYIRTYRHTCTCISWRWRPRGPPWCQRRALPRRPRRRETASRPHTGGECSRIAAAGRGLCVQASALILVCLWFLEVTSRRWSFV